MRWSAWLVVVVVACMAGASPSPAAPGVDAAAWQVEASPSHPNPPEYVEEDFNPVLAVLLLVAVGVVLVFVTAGAVLGALAVGILSLLVLLGVLSTSAVVALARRRWSDGLRTLVLQLSGGAGLILGGMVGLAVGWWVLPAAGLVLPTASGAAAGVLAGVLLAMGVNATCTRVAELVADRLRSPADGPLPPARHGG